MNCEESNSREKNTDFSHGEDDDLVIILDEQGWNLLFFFFFFKSE